MPGAAVKDYFDNDNQDDQFITSSDKLLELYDYDKKNPLITTKIEGSSEIKPLNFTDEMTAVKNVPEIGFDNDETIKTTVDVVPTGYTYYPNNPPAIVLNNNNFEFITPKKESKTFL